jgi:hypothetical protein
MTHAGATLMLPATVHRGWDTQVIELRCHRGPPRFTGGPPPPYHGGVARYPKPHTAPKLPDGGRRVSVIALVAIASCCNGCASTCPYVETGQLVISADKSNAPPLADVVGRAIKPFGFFTEDELQHNPATEYPTGNSTTGYPTSNSNRRGVRDRATIDFNHLEPRFFNKHPVVVSVDPVERRIYITDFASGAASDPFVKTVRDSIQQQVASVYGQQIDIQPPKWKRGEGMGCLLERF